MDPFSALGIAAATIQFVDFSAALLSTNGRIRSSKTGELQLESESRTIAEDLESHHGEMMDSRNGSGQGQAVSQTEKQIQIVCVECDAVAQDLLQAVHKLKTRRWGKKEKFGTFKQALQTIWSPEKIEELEQHFGKWRSQLVFLVVTALREQQTRLGSQVPLVQSTAAQNHRNGQRFLTFLQKNKQYYSEIHAAILENPSPAEGVHALSSGNEFETDILSALFFDRAQSREDRIPDACEETCEWIFQQPQPEQTRWTGFYDWLRGDSDQRIYWITGKAGAGKSTLMKFICNHQMTQELCHEWAGNERLLHAQFFCSDSEESMQMSREGLLRTLLYQTLSQYQHLAATAFPDRWEMFRLLGAQSDAPMTELYLQQGLERMIKSNPDTMFAFFVDGLDEFGENPDTLAAFFQNLALNSNIKICLSCRPWSNFKKSYGFRPSLCLEERNYPDIVQFAHSSLEKSTDFVHLCKQSPKQAQELVAAVADKASGVFVWVEAVLGILLEGLQDGERPSDLRRRLASVPSDLEPLFQKMLDSIEPERAEHASQLLQMVRAARAPVSLLCLSFAGEEDPHLAYEHPVEPLTEEQEAARSDQMRRRLHSHCKGLLKTTSSSTPATAAAPATVDHLHRTVRDYLHRGSVWHHILTSSPPFTPHLALAHASLLCLKTARLPGPSHWHDHSSSPSTTTTTLPPPTFSTLLLTTLHHTAASPAPHHQPLLDLLAATTARLIATHGPCPTSFCWCRGPADYPADANDAPFVALATQLQLVPWVAARLERAWVLPAGKRPEGGSGSSTGGAEAQAPLLHFAVVSASAAGAAAWGEGGEVEREGEGEDGGDAERRARLVGMLLEWGADPNYAGSGPSGSGSGMVSPWEEVVGGGGVEEFGEEVWEGFLRYGADRGVVAAAKGEWEAGGGGGGGVAGRRKRRRWYRRVCRREDGTVRWKRRGEKVG
ncbi:p-loop containing nucleoside triphosphate hydrolase [Diplodia corticola]|uniref:p-loop containing nucleoside triphosphate hydrolase n=1 Tax=Diplodia corticola TaxID=236234 RepID=A0A1J9S4M0_9PEZI|nr:p-loop containing nucleoside triphosphate hydrolase [Diplodia corticola]OJD35479.1 p-loop containing nucleoside triphosphate hydrolase [Diplodia corticola]